MGTNKKLWVLEYSEEQKSYNKDLLSFVLDKNTKAFLEGRTTSYMILYIGFREEVDALRERLHKEKTYEKTQRAKN